MWFSLPEDIVIANLPGSAPPAANPEYTSCHLAYLRVLKVPQSGINVVDEQRAQLASHFTQLARLLGVKCSAVRGTQPLLQLPVSTDGATQMHMSSPWWW